MFIDILKRHKILFVSISIILVLIIVAIYFVVDASKFKVLSVSPNPRNISYLTPRLTVEFSKPLAGDNYKINTNGVLTTAKVEGNKLIISIDSNLKPNQSYDFTIESVRSSSGDEIKNYSIQIYSSGNTTISDEERAIILSRQQDDKSPIINNPIFKYVPHSTLSYEIDGKIDTSKSKPITLVITVELTAADVRIGRDSVVESARQDAMTYLKSLTGISIDDYFVTLVVKEPNL